MDYDGKDQLRRAIAMKNNAVVGSEEYWYDQNGSRLATLKLDKQGNPTELIWWNGDMEFHYDGTGALNHVFSYITMGPLCQRS